MTVNIFTESVILVHFEIVKVTDFALLECALTFVIDMLFKFLSFTGHEGFAVCEWTFFENEGITVLLVMRLSIT